VKKEQYWRLKDADGKPTGLMGWWPSKAVTFIDNHDTGVAAGRSTACTVRRARATRCVLGDLQADWVSARNAKTGLIAA
jgi:hypothetical protein